VWLSGPGPNRVQFAPLPCLLSLVKTSQEFSEPVLARSTYRFGTEAQASLVL